MEKLADPRGGYRPCVSERTTADLARQASEQVSGLVRDEFRLAGREQLKRSTPMVPERSFDSVRGDIDSVKTAVERRNRR